MSHACCSPPDGGAAPRIDTEAPRLMQGAAPFRMDGAATTATDALALAASPTFAAMALATGVLGGDAAALCLSAPMPALGGMSTMYLLMSAFHAAPWLNLIRRGRSRKAVLWSGS